MTNGTPFFLGVWAVAAYRKEMFQRNKATTRSEQLAAVPLFSSCSTKERTQLARLTEEVAVRAGDVVVRQGDVGTNCHIIVEGAVSVSVNDLFVTTLGAGEHFGELALIDNQPRSATVTATTDCTLLVLGSQEFASALESTPGLTVKLLAALANRIRLGNAANAANAAA